MSTKQNTGKRPDVPAEEATDESVFVVVAHWDDDAKVFYSESNIIGLHIEADTIEEFEEVMQSLAPELCYLNHLSKRKEGVFRRLYNFTARIFNRDFNGSPQSHYPPVIVMKEHGSVPAPAE